MKERIARIIQYKNLTNAQFAKYIGVQPSNVTHILNGRNKPSLDFLLKIIDCFPEISLEWLILGKGEMLIRAETQSVKSVSGEQTNNQATSTSSHDISDLSLFPQEEKQQTTETVYPSQYAEDNPDMISLHTVKSEQHHPYTAKTLQEEQNDFFETETKNVTTDADVKTEEHIEFTNVKEEQNTSEVAFPKTNAPERVLLIYDDDTFEIIFLRKKK